MLIKEQAQAKIIKKSVILFWLINMTIWCKHVHRPEVQKFLNFCAQHEKLKTFAVLVLWTCFHHMVIFINKPKFLMILAWDCPFNVSQNSISF